MVLFGHIGEFAEGHKEWPQYMERMEHFLSANGIDSNEPKRAVFLSVIGRGIYKLLCSLVAPEKLGEKTFAELVAALTQHFAPKQSKIVQRYKYHTHFRRQGESVAVRVRGGVTCIGPDLQFQRHVGGHAQRLSGVRDG